MNSQNNQSIEALTDRYTKLHEKRIRVQSDLKHAEDHLSKLKTHAMETWGTDDLATLENMLKEMLENNERKRSEYQQHLDEIEAKLKQIDENDQVTGL